MNIPEAKRWLTYAQSDLDAAQVLLQSHEAYPRQICFLAQQAAEKSLKAILVLLGLKFPYTHDLDHLRELVPSGWRVKDAFPKLYALSIWAIDARYPDDMPDVVEADAKEALQLAKAIYQTIITDIKEQGVQLND
jgi:HEPN domain-containing protein